MVVGGGGVDFRERDRAMVQIYGWFWTFLLWARLDRGLGDGVKDAAVLPRVVSVTDTLHLVAACLQERRQA